MEATALQQLCKKHPDKLDPLLARYGGSPLHCCLTKKALTNYLKDGMDTESRNQLQHTPLLAEVLRPGRLDFTVGLLSHGAMVDAVDDQGNTALHLATVKNDKSAVMALLLFGADAKVRNKAGKSAIDIAQEGLHLKGVEDVGPILARGGSFDRESISLVHDNPDSIKNGSAHTEKGRGTERKPARVLCLDGGGIRGLILIEMLMAIEELIGRPLKDCFDWIAGTSTGAIVALAVATGKTMKDARKSYLTMKDEVFVGSKPYSADVLSEMLQLEFGPDTKMADLTGPRVLIPGVLADRHPPALHLYCNYERHTVGAPLEDVVSPTGTKKFFVPAKHTDQRVWEAARGSGAAPYYFLAHGCVVDGGLMANNPTLECLTEICSINARLKKEGRMDEVEKMACVLSLGTGQNPVKYVENVNFIWPNNLKSLEDLTSTIPALKQLMVGQVTQSDGHVVDRARAWCDSLDVPFYRFNPPIEGKVSLDCTDTKTLINMMWRARCYMRDQQATLQELLAILLRPN